MVPKVKFGRETIPFCRDMLIVRLHFAILSSVKTTFPFLFAKRVFILK